MRSSRKITEIMVPNEIHCLTPPKPASLLCCVKHKIMIATPISKIDPSNIRKRSGFITCSVFALIFVISSGYSIVQHFPQMHRRHRHSQAIHNDNGEPVHNKDDEPLVVEPKFHVQHHTAIKTKNITMAISFYGLFGYEVTCQFRAGPARAAWMQLPDDRGRLELIEVPSYLIQQPRAPNLSVRPDILGFNHVALDVSAQIQKESETSENKTFSLATWIQDLNRTSMVLFNKTLRTAVYPPQQQIIGSNVYDIAFLYDADGCLLELLHQTHSLPQRVSSGWEPWNSTDFT